VAGWIRASEMDRVLVCHGPLVMPRTGSPSGESACWGISCHKWAETGEIVAHEDYRRHQPHLEKKLGQYDRLAIWPEGAEEDEPGNRVFRELALSRNTLTGEGRFKADGTSEEKMAWKLSHDSEWETGSADYVSVDPLGHATVDDLKTGRFPPDVETSLQLQWYSLACVAAGLAKTATSSITHLPRYPVKADVVRYDRSRGRHYTEREMAVLCEKLNAAHEALTGKRHAVLVIGEGCRFCPCKSICPMLNKTEENK
jgi:PD-(D/E)XK nuclease superfamily